ncbi:MAG: dihydrofolate reductase [Bacteroidales bacterium]|nr:dihydrofolate reductase [Bacteroidales bacterium]
MMSKLKFIMGLSVIVALSACTGEQTKKDAPEEFKWVADRFADCQILRYQVEGFDQMTLDQKKFLYYLQEAAYWGREIIYDQQYRHNLCVKRTMEAAYANYKDAKDDPEFLQFEVYLKRIWMSNGIHHHYSTEKFLPECSQEFMTKMIQNVPDEQLPLNEGETKEQLIAKLLPIMFDPTIDAKRVCLDPTKDVILESATNYYGEDLTQKEVEDFYEKMAKKNDPQPLSYGINSKLVKENGVLVEKVYKLGGMYSAAIEKIIENLTLAQPFATTEKQKEYIGMMIELYKTGDLKLFDESCVVWVQDTDPVIDFTNYFIENYGDPIGKRGGWQSVVYMKDFEMTKRLQALAENAQWFEDNAPFMPEHKKKEVKGISYKVVNVTAEAGDNSPSTAIGVNLPNADWIRAEYGSKSVSLGNIENAYDEASKTGGTLSEFFLPEDQAMIKQYSSVAGKMHTALHEVIGHGSGQLEAGVASPDATLKNYSSILEEARAELVGLYYIMDPKLVELGLLETNDAGKAEYDSYITNGLMRQLTRLQLGQNVEQAHMCARSTLAHWCYENGKAENVIEKVVKEGKTYFHINDYAKLRNLFGQLLKEVQRIKSQGDFEAGKALVETYGKPVDRVLHEEVLERYAQLNLPPYSGFIQPQLVPEMKDGQIVDVKVTIPESFVEQMMFYRNNYSVLPTYN